MIKNYEVYTKGLHAGLQDKIFFLSKIIPSDYDTVIDFGAGTGEVLRAIRPTFSPYADLIGIENNTTMLVSARYQAIDYDNVRFYPKIEDLNISRNKEKKTLLIFSSVLHEITDIEGLRVLNELINMSDTVVIRDMKAPSERYVSVIDSIGSDAAANIVNKTPMYMKEDFKEVFGDIFASKINLYQFLLRYTYVDNWKHELKENYFHGEFILSTGAVALGDFNLVYNEEFRLPHQVKQIRETFGYELDDTTHMKRIYERGRKL